LIFYLHTNWYFLQTWQWIPVLYHGSHSPASHAGTSFHRNCCSNDDTAVWRVMEVITFIMNVFLFLFWWWKFWVLNTWHLGVNIFILSSCLQSLRRGDRRTTMHIEILKAARTSYRQHEHMKISLWTVFEQFKYAVSRLNKISSLATYFTTNTWYQSTGMLRGKYKGHCSITVVTSKEK
jgi:hypothetical protein